MARKLRWWSWVTTQRIRLRRQGVDLVVEARGTPTFDTPPSIELTHDGYERTGGRYRLTLRLGFETHLGRNLVLEVRECGSGLLELADRAFLQGNVRIVLFDGEVHLGERAWLREGVVVRCSGGTVRLGRHSQLGAHCVVHCARSVVLHDFSQVAEHCSFVDSDHVHDGSDTWVLEQPVRTGEVSFGPNSIAGGGVRFLRDSHVGANSAVAAGSVVLAGRHPASSLLVGAPARVARSLASQRLPAG